MSLLPAQPPPLRSPLPQPKLPAVPSQAPLCLMDLHGTLGCAFSLCKHSPGALLRFLSFLMGSLPHPCSAAGLPKCQGDSMLGSETVCSLPSAAGERWVDVWVASTVGTRLAGAGATGKDRDRWLREAKTCLALLADPLIPTHRHQRPTSTSHVEMRQELSCVYIIE